MNLDDLTRTSGEWLRGTGPELGQLSAHPVLDQRLVPRAFICYRRPAGETHDGTT